MKLEAVHSVRMVGIGGIGMSALARFLHLRGKKVTGYDRTETPLTRALVAEGIEVDYAPQPDRVRAADLFIYTPAIPPYHPEFDVADVCGLVQMKRAEALGMISRSYKTIGIAGTHGKTSTAGLTTHLLRSCGIDVTGFIGGIVNNFASNFINGDSEWLVVEADEFDRSFLHLNPDIAVITSMDADHLDIYGEPEAVRESFFDYIKNIPAGGTLFLQHNWAGPELEAGPRIWKYGVSGGLCRADNLVHRGLGVTFDYHGPRGSMRELQLERPGRYNVENAVAAISIAVALGAEEDDIRAGLASFRGIQRRFDVRYRTEEVVYIDDYAHHPSEIKAVVAAVRSMLPGFRLIAVFQPHLYSRTRDFFPGFAGELSEADAVVLLDIYPAREQAISGVSSQLIFDLLTVEDRALTDLANLPETLEQFKTRPAAVLSIGAGNIDTKREAIQELVARW
ncbi:MAG: UDP-N-acetylmuramate--L-alanine ligase [Bacteroidota bacterium]